MRMSALTAIGESVRARDAAATRSEARGTMHD